MIQKLQNAPHLKDKYEEYSNILENLNNPAVIRNASSDLKDELKQRAELATAFLKDILSPGSETIPDGKLSLTYNFDGKIINKIYSTKKIYPKKENTTTLGEIIAYIGEVSNVYMNLPIYYNTITCEHSENNISSIYCIGLDVDNFPLDRYATNEEKTKAIFNKYPFLNIIPPNKLVDSGNKGFHIYYLFDSDLYNNKIKIKEVSKVISLIINADYTKTSANNKLRIPFTQNISTNATNTRKPRLSTIIYENPIRYNFYDFLSKVKTFTESNVIVKFYDKGSVLMSKKDYEEILEETPLYAEDFINLDETFVVKDYVCHHTNFFRECFDSNNKYKEGFLQTKNKRTRKLPYSCDINKFNGKYTISTYYKRLSLALKEYLNYTNGRLTGMRNNYLYFCAVTNKQLNMNNMENLYQLKQLNNSFTEPLSNNQVKAIWSCVQKHNYRISAAMVKDALNLDDNYLSGFGIATTKEERKAKKRERNKKLAALRKKQRNVKAKKIKQISLVKKYLKKDIAKKKILQLVGISKSTLYRIIRILGLTKTKCRYNYETLKTKIKKLIHNGIRKVKTKLINLTEIPNIKQSARHKELYAILC